MQSCRFFDIPYRPARLIRDILLVSLGSEWVKIHEALRKENLCSRIAGRHFYCYLQKTNKWYKEYRTLSRRVMKKVTEYFLAPDGKYSNDVLRQLPLDEGLIVRDARLQEGGNPINLWEANEAQLRYLLQCMKDDPQFRFVVYRKSGARFVKMQPQRLQLKIRANRITLKKVDGMATLKKLAKVAKHTFSH